MTAQLVKDAVVVRDGIDWVAAIPEGDGLWAVTDRFNAANRGVRLREAIKRCDELIAPESTFTDGWKGLYREMAKQLRLRYELEHPYAPSPS